MHGAGAIAGKGTGAVGPPSPALAASFLASVEACRYEAAILAWARYSRCTYCLAAFWCSSTAPELPSSRTCATEAARSAAFCDSTSSSCTTLLSGSASQPLQAAGGALISKQPPQHRVPSGPGRAGAQAAAAAAAAAPQHLSALASSS
jgi:hypothetical protein